MRTFQVYALRVGLNDVGGHIACYLQYLLVVLDGILVVDGCIVMLFCIGVVLLFQVYDALHQRMIQVKRYLGMIAIIVCHNSFLFVFLILLFNSPS